MPRRKDLWRCGIVDRPLADVVRLGLADATVEWLPDEPRFTFLADPFGVRLADGAMALFVEHYDYRERHGRIERLRLDPDGCVVERQPALAEPWHLSYPVPIAADGAQWLLPEAHRSGALTLYRAQANWSDWRAETTIALDVVPVDATPWHDGERWWLFYSPGTSKAAKVERLHLAWADRLTGPWHPHPQNPVRIGRDGSRPGGTPALVDGRVMLPVQDCARTYGGAVRPLWINRLDPEGWNAELGLPLTLPPGGWAGMHTLSACGERTLIDVKTIDRSLAGLGIEWAYHRRRIAG